MRSRLLIAVYAAGLFGLTFFLDLASALAIVVLSAAAAIAAGKSYGVFRILPFEPAFQAYLRSSVSWSRAQIGFLAAALISSQVANSPHTRLIIVVSTLSLLIASFAAARLGCFHAGCCSWTSFNLKQFDGRVIEACLGISGIFAAFLLVWIGTLLLGAVWLALYYLVLRICSLLMQRRFWLAKRETAYVGCCLALLVSASII